MQAAGALLNSSSANSSLHTILRSKIVNCSILCRRILANTKLRHRNLHFKVIRHKVRTSTRMAVLQ